MTAATDARPALIEARGLTLHAAGRCLVRDLHWHAHAGERWCVMGRNATGKSSLLRALAGLSVPGVEGGAFWQGRPQRDWLAVDAACFRAFMPQHASDRFALSVQRLLELSVVVPGVHGIAAVLQELDAAELAVRSVTHLSGGERQRIGLAQCVLQGAPLLLMDEPVAFQDPAHQLQVSRWLAGLDGMAMVVSAHDVNWVARTATHVLMLYGQDGEWEGGSVADMLNAERLQRLYGCRWLESRGVWAAT